MPKDKITLTPFEKARENITKTAENLAFCCSVELLVEALMCLDFFPEKTEYGAGKELDEVCVKVMIELSEFLENRDSVWN